MIGGRWAWTRGHLELPSSRSPGQRNGGRRGAREQAGVLGMGGGRLWAWHLHRAFPPLTLRLSSSVWKAFRSDGKQLPVWRGGEGAVASGGQRAADRGWRRFGGPSGGPRGCQIIRPGLEQSPSWGPDSRYPRPHREPQVITQSLRGRCWPCGHSARAVGQAEQPS